MGGRGAGGALAVLLRCCTLAVLLRCCTLAVLLAAAAAPASGGGGQAPGVGTVVVGELLGETSERYASWNVDMSFNRGFSHINFTNPNLIAAAVSLRPSTLRCGGTGNDYQHYALGSHANVPCPAPANDTDFWGCVNATHWDNFYDFSVAAGADMLLGVSFDNDAACAAGPDYAFDPAPHGVTGLLEHLAARGQRVWGFELGNEINNLNDPAKPSGGCKLEPGAQAAGLRRLKEAVEEVGLPQRPVFVGPDTGYFACHGQRGAECPWLAGYLEDMRDAGALGMLHAVTHHVYAGITAENFNSPAQLDKAQADPEWYLPIVRRFQAPGGAPLVVWAGENGPKAGGEDGTCGAASVCGAFGSALWYADELGRRAQWGYTQHQRQDLLGGRYGLVHIPHGNEALGPADPVALTPDFWVNFFWKRTMGRRAHNATALPAGFGGGLVRAYAHRGPPSSPDAPPELRRRPADAWSTVLINLSPNATFAVRLAEGAGAGAPRVVSWTLTPEAGSGLAARALANGRPLPAGIADGAAIADVPVPGAVHVGAPLRLPPLSVTFAAAVPEA